MSRWEGCRELCRISAVREQTQVNLPLIGGFNDLKTMIVYCAPRDDVGLQRELQGCVLWPFRTVRYSCHEEDEVQKVKKKTYLPSMAFRPEKTQNRDLGRYICACPYQSSLEPCSEDQQ